MSDMMAVKIAIDLLLVPSQVRLLRAEPLPDGVVMLLRIAAGDDEAESAAAGSMDRTRDVIRRAATFFIEQILFAPDADSYRVLGAGPQASPSELRQNVALLLRWLHPDLDRQGERSIFVGKVTGAWNNVKTPERRAAYDAQRRFATDRTSRIKTGRSKSKQLAAALRRRKARLRHEAWLSGAGKMGFFRRALSILHKAIQ
jgi:hypothetical protein